MARGFEVVAEQQRDLIGDLCESLMVLEMSLFFAGLEGRMDISRWR
jgi:hypothetical protein